MAEAGDYFDEVDEDKNTTLHRAAAANRVEDVVNLLEAGCKVDPVNSMGWTPLMMAARNGKIDVVKILIENRADATKKNLYGMSVLVVSVASGNVDVVKHILRHLLLGGVSRQSMEAIMSPFLPAVVFRHENMVQFLIQNCFNVNVVASCTGVTPVLLAAIVNDSNIFNMLIGSGADPNVQTVNKQSAVDVINLNPDLRLFINPKRQRKLEAIQPHQQQMFCGRQRAISNDDHQNYVNQHHFQAPQIQFFSPQQCPQPFPMFYFSPQPVFLDPSMAPQQQSQDGQRMTKSSNILTPLCMVSPSISPITPQLALTPQVFFPTEFNQGCIGSPYSSDNSVFNQRIFQFPTP